MAQRDSSAYDRLALHIAQGRTLNDSARLSGVSRRSAARYAGTDVFKVEVRRLRDVLLHAALGKLVSYADAAAEALGTIAADKSQPSAARVAAARALFNVLIEIRTHEDLSERLAELERRQAQAEAAGASGSNRGINGYLSSEY